jgi:hypothetical protein
MAIIWLISAILGIAGNSMAIYYLYKSGSPGGAVPYAMNGVSLLLSVVLLYAAVVEGLPLAYALIACGIVHLVVAIYYMIVPPTLLNPSDGKPMSSTTHSTFAYVSGGVGILFALVLVYWGYQRYTLATMAPVMLGGRRRRR